MRPGPRALHAIRPSGGARQGPGLCVRVIREGVLAVVVGLHQGGAGAAVPHRVHPHRRHAPAVAGRRDAQPLVVLPRALPARPRPALPRYPRQPPLLRRSNPGSAQTLQRAPTRTDCHVRAWAHARAHTHARHGLECSPVRAGGRPAARIAQTRRPAEGSSARVNPPPGPAPALAACRFRPNRLRCYDAILLRAA